MNPVYAALHPTIFEVMSARARANGAINLGQGFPDAGLPWGAPADVVRVAADALSSLSNQYPPMLGLPALREAIASHYAAHQGLGIGADEVIVTSGATEALAAAILALVTPGDEVVVFAPAYDAYRPLIERAGGRVRVVRLEPPDWRITREALERVGNGRTRLIVFNSPLNPTGSVATLAELSLLAEFCGAHDAVAICDEVWEHLIFDAPSHVSLMTFPGMRERTVKIGSAGKIFSLTGWKVGWMCAAPALSAVLARSHQFLTFTTPPNLQSAVAYGLGKDTSYFDAMRAGYQASRDHLSAGLAARGYDVLASPATWFVTVDLAASGISIPDKDWCLWAVEEAGVAAIPVSAFYDEDPITNVVRLCHAKEVATLDAALQRLEKRP